MNPKETTQKKAGPKPGPKPGPRPQTSKQVTPSEKLAALLRKEATLVGRAKKAAQDLQAVQNDIRSAWAERERLNSEVLKAGQGN